MELGRQSLKAGSGRGQCDPVVDGLLPRASKLGRLKLVRVLANTEVTSVWSMVIQISSTSSHWRA